MFVYNAQALSASMHAGIYGGFQIILAPKMQIWLQTISDYMTLAVRTLPPPPLTSLLIMLRSSPQTSMNDWDTRLRWDGFICRQYLLLTSPNFLVVPDSFFIRTCFPNLPFASIYGLILSFPCSPFTPLLRLPSTSHFPSFFLSHSTFYRHITPFSSFLLYLSSNTLPLTTPNIYYCCQIHLQISAKLLLRLVALKHCAS